MILSSSFGFSHLESKIEKLRLGFVAQKTKGSVIFSFRLLFKVEKVSFLLMLVQHCEVAIFKREHEPCMDVIT